MISSLLCVGALALAAEPVVTVETAETHLYVRTTPPGAAVLVDGKSLGKSDDLFQVSPGRRKITVQLEGWEPQEQQLDIAEGRVTRVVFRLKAKVAAPGQKAGAPPADGIQLRYGWKDGASYIYRVKIEADLDDSIQEFTGDLTYSVASAKQDQVELRCNGMLARVEKVKPGRFLHRFPSPSPWVFGLHTMGGNRITVDRYGGIIKIEGGPQVPWLLGNLSQLAIEPLSPSGQRSWSAGGDTSIFLSYDRFPLPLFSPTGGIRESLPAKEKTTYSMEPSAGKGPVTIVKRYELSTAAQVMGKPQFEVTGDGKFVFNKDLGVVNSLDYESKLTLREGNTTVTVPLKVNYRLLDEAERARLAAEAEKAKKELERPLAAHEVEEAVADLESGEMGRVLRATERLSRRTPKVGDRKVAQALATIALDNSSPAVRTAAARALQAWSTPESVPALIKLVDDSWPQVRGHAMETLAKYKPREAIEPVAKRLSEMSDRAAASKFLKAAGPEAQKAVLKQLENRDPWTRSEVCEILKVIGTAESLPALEKATHESDWHVKMLAEQAVSAIKQRQRRSGEEGKKTPGK